MAFVCHDLISFSRSAHSTLAVQLNATRLITTGYENNDVIFTSSVSFVSLTGSNISFHMAAKTTSKRGRNIDIAAREMQQYGY